MQTGPTLIGLHRQAKEPQTSSASLKHSVSRSTAADVTAPASSIASGGSQHQPPEVVFGTQTTRTIFDSTAVFDSAFAALNSATQLLLRGSSVQCCLATAPQHSTLARGKQAALSPAFVFLGKGATALCGFWKGPSQELSAEEAFVLPLVELTEVRLGSEFRECTLALVTPGEEVILMLPDIEARNDWVSAVLLIRGCLPGGSSV